MSQAPQTGSRGPVKSPLDLAGGLFLLALAVIGFAGAYNLPTGTLSGIGSGLLPKTLALLIAAFGLLLIVHAFLYEGDHLEQWHLRGPLYVLGGVVVFALLIRGSTLTFGGIFGVPVLATVKVPGLGLIVAGPLAVIVSAFADRTTRPVEIVVYSLVITLLSGLLFKEFLNLPIPFDPVGLVPASIDNAYAEVRSAILHGLATFKNLFTF
ncbi:MAG: tripartite tricarboxylate transporter TctB family protein [Hyphomicrobiaceae bacterium]|nr:tripartite tricarboxylate transporter TctB family protein [Hyphomicrobiaceae bacterium]